MLFSLEFNLYPAGTTKIQKVRAKHKRARVFRLRGDLDLDKFKVLNRIPIAKLFISGKFFYNGVYIIPLNVLGKFLIF